MRPHSPELEEMDAEIAVLERELERARTAMAALPQDDYRRAQKGTALLREEELQLALHALETRRTELRSMELEWGLAHHRFRQARPYGATKVDEYRSHLQRGATRVWGPLPSPVWWRHAGILGLLVLLGVALGLGSDSDGDTHVTVVYAIWTTTTAFFSTVGVEIYRPSTGARHLGLIATTGLVVAVVPPLALLFLAMTCAGPG